MIYSSKIVKFDQINKIFLPKCAFLKNFTYFWARILLWQEIKSLSIHSMKRIISLIFALTLTVAAFGQNPTLRQRMEITQVEVNDGVQSLEVFQMEDNGHYYLSVGHLGIGDDIIQLNIDPIFELFIPLGETLAEAVEKLDQLKEFYKEDPRTSMEVDGCLCAAYPNDEWEPVTVTSRRVILTKVLEFSVKRDDFIRATHIAKSDFASLVAGVKLYKKIHPNEK